MKWAPAIALAAALVLSPSAGSHSRMQNAGIVWGWDYHGVFGADVDGGHSRLVASYFPWARSFGGPDGYTKPAWSPSGDALAYHVWASATNDIIVLEPRARVKRSLLGSWEAAGSPAWSPDEEQLAFAGGTVCCWTGIWVVSLRSGGVRAITEERVGRVDDHPAWSPDGRTIAFTRSVVDQPPVIYTVTLDRRERWITKGASPSWSPSGRWLIFGWGEGIYRVNADGSGRTRLARVRGTRSADLNARWSPDGRKILFTTHLIGSGSDPARGGIWVMNADGTGRRRVVAVTGNLHGAAWRPG